MRKKRNPMVIPKHKVPNLCKPGLRFDQNQTQNVTFFSRVENTFKLLQEPVKKERQLFENQILVNIQKNKTTQRFKRFSENDIIKSTLHRNSSFHPTRQKDQKTKRLSFKKRIVAPSPSPKLSENQINGSKLAPIPLERILQARKKILQQNEKSQLNYEEMSQMDSDVDNSLLEEEEIFRPKEKQKNLEIWAQMIVGNQERVYDYFDKQIMEKTKLYLRKKKKMNHQNLWR